MEEVRENLNKSLGGSAPPAEPQVNEPDVKPNEPTEPPKPEPVVEPVTEPVATEPPEVKKEPVEYYKEYGFNNPDEFKSSFNDWKTKAEEYEQKKPYIEELEKSLDELVKTIDPLNMFKGDEKEYENFLIAQKIGQGKDMGVVQQIIRNDLSTMSDLDILKLKWRYDTPSLANKSDDRVQKAILEDLGVDIEDPEFKLEEFKPTDSQEIKLARLATLARNEFNQAKANIEKPERVDVKKKIEEQTQAKLAAEKAREEKFNKMAQDWQEMVKGVAESEITKFEHKMKNDKNEEVTDFVFEMDADYKKAIPEMIMSHVLSNGMEPTKENFDFATNLVRTIYRSENFERYAEAYANKKLTELREQLDKERYNGTDFNTKTAPPGKDADLGQKLTTFVTQKLGIK